jgi:hypothetical protein
MIPRSEGLSRTRAAFRVAAVAGVASIVSAGCWRAPTRPPATTRTTRPTPTWPSTTTTTRPAPTTAPSTSSPPTTTPPVPPGAGYYTAELARTPAGTTPWFCNAAGDGTPLAGHGNGAHVNPIYAGKKKGPLSSADCTLLAKQLDDVLNVVNGLDTRGKAEASGWSASAEYLQGLGTHHIRTTDGIGAGFRTTFDISRPTFLVYGGSDADAPLVGVSYGVAGSTTPPVGFAGENDWWHLHKKICLAMTASWPPKILAGAEEVTDAACTALGGFNSTIPSGGMWLLHLWPTPPHQYRLDLFASGHNCMLATRLAPESDPCWELARRDPALGMPPGHGGADPGGDDHGDHGH